MNMVVHDTNMHPDPKGTIYALQTYNLLPLLEKVKVNLAFSSPASRSAKKPKGENSNGEKIYIYIFIPPPMSVCDEGPGICAHMLTLVSMLLIMATLPLSLIMAIKVVQVRTTQSKCAHLLTLCSHTCSP